MASSEDDRDSNDEKDDKKINRSMFVRLLLLDKSKTPSVMKSKTEAWSTPIAEYSSLIGKLFTVIQLKKVVQNINTTIKKKTDVKASGNKPIKLKKWENEFLQLTDKRQSSISQNPRKYVGWHWPIYCRKQYCGR
ncbi:unnamed protein product [Psylliodes chrysocephalus]|uniref:Uncharacterized protein n=1 Tax=Psylliodes chrysocephalus TaxID=3402493 RepID=A0A9P0CX07_9CUCU|nr:unnamed protein product [Psylliodes chrysocephala]